jgi:hypothetical protein
MCWRKHGTPVDRVSVHCAQPTTGVASARWDKNIPAGQTQTMLGQLCTAPWVSQSQSAVTEPGLKPGFLVAQIALVMQCVRPLRHLGGPTFLVWIN